MLKKLLIIWALSLSALHASAQVVEAFLGMPDTICPFLGTQQRVQLLQYAKAGVFDPVQNRFDGQTRMDSLNLSAEYISLQMTNNLHWVMTTMAGMIRIEKTISAPISSTTFLYYDFAWNLLRTEHEPFRPFPPDEDIYALKTKK